MIFTVTSLIWASVGGAGKYVCRPGVLLVNAAAFHHMLLITRDLPVWISWFVEPFTPDVHWRLKRLLPTSG